MAVTSFTQAVKWSFFSDLAAKAVQPITFVILARLLTPEDFGVMSAAIMVIAFSQVLWEAGMGKAVIQRQTDVGDAANAAFWINVCLGLVVASVLFFLSEHIAESVYHDARVRNVVQVLTIQVFFGAISSVHIALLQKEMEFKKLFWARFVTVSLPGIAAIPVALGGGKYWALVFGAVIGQGVQAVILWRQSSWRPSLSLKSKVAREVGAFGAWVTVSGLLAWFYIWADSLIIGIYLGSHELGLYRTGNQMAIMIFATLFGPVIPVLYSHLAKLNQNSDSLRFAAERVIKSLAIIAIPLAFILFSLSQAIGDAFFGPNWKGIGFVIGVMSLMHGYSWIVGMNGEIYRAMGRPAYETIVTAVTLTIYIVIYLIAIRGGLEIFTWARLALALFGVLVHLLLIRKVLCLRIAPLTRYIFGISLLFGIAIYAVHLLFTNNFDGAWSKIIVGGGVGSLMIVVLIGLLERKGLLIELQTMIRGRSI